MKVVLTLDLQDVKNTPVIDWGEAEDVAIEKAQRSAPAKEVVLPPNEAQVEPPNTDPVKYTVVKGDTLKKIAEKFSVSYGELVNYMMEKIGNTAIYPDMEIEIPRHFVDLSQA